MQPRKSVRSRDGDHTQMGLIDHGFRGDKEALFAQRLTKVGRHSGIDACPATAPGRESSGEDKILIPFLGCYSTRLSWAEEYDCNSCPKAAISCAHINLPCTSPNRRVAASTSAPEFVRAIRSVARSMRGPLAIPK